MIIPISPDRLVVFFLIPIVSILLALTNPMHHLIWQNFTIQPVHQNMHILKVKQYGYWFWVLVLYCYSMFFCGTYFIIREYFQAQRLYQKQSIWVVIGAVSSMAINLVYIFRVIPGLTKDFSSVAFAFGGICFIIGTIKYRLFLAAPINRNGLIDRMNDSLIVMDANLLIVDANRAALKMIGKDEYAVLGREIREIYPFFNEKCLPADLYPEKKTEAELERDKKIQKIEMKIVRILNEQAILIGYYIFIRSLDVPEEIRQDLETRFSGIMPPALLADSFGRIIGTKDLDGFTDYTQEELLLKNLSDIFLEDILARISKAGDQSETPLTLLHKSGIKIPVQTVIEIAESEKEGLIGLTLRITDMKFPRELFSFRENEIIDGIIRGLTNKEIADKLHIAEGTVKNHVSNILGKLQAENRTQAADIARRRGLV